MADTANKVQVNALFSRDGAKLLRTLQTTKSEALGIELSLGALLEMLVKQEAKRQGIKQSR